uniref:Uncharacterized protein n=1 Tax=Anguilla anguilla TaxID=7936 RepID=A0A0E9XS12_ANGAN
MTLLQGQLFFPILSVFFFKEKQNRGQI